MRKVESNWAGGVTVLPVREDGAVGLLRLFRHPAQQIVWEAPRGFIDNGEPSAISAAREVEEEIGLSCKVEELVSLGTFLPEAGILRIRAYLFAAYGFSLDSKVILSNEIGHLGFSWFSWEEIQEKVMTSEIEDGATLAILLKLMLFKQNIEFTNMH